MAIANENNTSFTPLIHFSGTGYKSRNIAEINLMLPLFQEANNLILTDIKFKNDNRRSTEYNLGLVYRYNFSDKLIFGFYNYFDRRITANDFYVNQWTVGLELLNNYIDSRLNIYVAQNKKKIIKPSTIEFVRDKTRIYGLKKGALEEHALSGYDIEFGVPIFSLSSELNDKFGTKFYLARYYFQKKGIAKNIGTRLRFEQPIYNNYFNKRNSELALFLGSSKTNGEKSNNFAGISFRIAIGKNSSNFTKTGLKKRMMANIVRDVDIVTSSKIEDTAIVPLYWDKQIVQNIYFVGHTDEEGYEGNGSYEQPFTLNQLKKLKNNKNSILQSTDLILPITSGEELYNELYVDEFNELIDECSQLNSNSIRSIKLQAESTSFKIEEYFPEIYKTRRIINNYKKTIQATNNTDDRSNIYAINSKNPSSNNYSSDNKSKLNNQVIMLIGNNEFSSLPVPVDIDHIPSKEIFVSDKNKKKESKPDSKYYTLRSQAMRYAYEGKAYKNFKNLRRKNKFNSVKIASNDYNTLSPRRRAMRYASNGKTLKELQYLRKNCKIIQKNQPNYNFPHPTHSYGSFNSSNPRPVPFSWSK